jgi:hypothetical protein
VPLAPQSSYRLVLQDIRGMLGASRKSDRAFTTPKPPAKDTTSKTGATPGGAVPPGNVAPGGARPPGFSPAKPPADSTKSPKPPEAFDRP